MTGHIDVLAETLASAGVTHAFGVLGSGSSYALMSALAEHGVVYQPAGHEAAAAMMAGAACRAGTTRAAALSIKGPGMANLVPAILANRYEARPAVTVSEAYAPDAPASLQHKRLDHSATLAAVARGIAYADTDGTSVRAALAHAAEEAPAPVHVELCGQPVERPYRPLEVEGMPGGDAAMEIALDRIARAERPALILGSAVTRLAPHVDWSMAGVPVATTAAAKGAIDETLSQSAGVVTGESGELSPEAAVLAHADLIIGVGLRAGEVVRAAPFAAPLVLVDCIGGTAHAGFAPEVAVITPDLPDACARVLDALGGAPSWGEDLISARASEIARRLSEGWLPSHVFASCSAHAADAVLVLDTGLFCIVGEVAWPARRPDLFCGSSNGRFMGTGIPTGIGIAVAESRPVIVAVGDGGARPYLSEMRILATASLPVLVVVMNDGAFGTIASGDPERRIGADALATGGIGWARVAEALGIESAVADDAGQADRAIAEWSTRPRPLLLEARFDPTAYVGMVKGLR